MCGVVADISIIITPNLASSQSPTILRLTVPMRYMYFSCSSSSFGCSIFVCYFLQRAVLCGKRFHLTLPISGTLGGLYP